MKRSVSIILVIVLALALAVTVYAASGDTTVYRTASGSKYHTENCSSLKGNGVAITLQEAVDKGLEPCSKCNPPTLDDASAASTASTEAKAESSEEASTGSAIAASVTSVEESSSGRKGISPVLTFFIGFLVGAIVMVIVYRKFGPAVLAAQAEEEAEAEDEESEE